MIKPDYLALAVDFGDARTGLAVTDRTWTIPVTLGNIESGSLRRVAEEVARIASERGCSVIVIGDPINMNGTRGPRCERTAALADTLKTLTDAEIVMLDERLTTAGAYRVLLDAGTKGRKKRKVIDTVSAALLLETYMGRVVGSS